MSSFRSVNLYLGQCNGKYQRQNFKDFIDSEVCPLVRLNGLSSEYNEERFEIIGSGSSREIYDFIESGFGIEHILFDRTNVCGIVLTSKPSGMKIAGKLRDLLYNMNQK